MTREDPGPDDPMGRKQRRAARWDLGFRAALVACLWLLLSLLEIPQVVAIATIAAVFGPDVIRASLGFFSVGPPREK
jgi:hypothetical protein